MSMSTGTNSRREVRSLIFHLLYALESSEYSIPVDDVAKSFNDELELDNKIDEEVITITQSIVDKKDQLSAIMLPFLSHWRLDRIGCCTRLILYIAFWEMHFSKTPRTIIINEAIELAKCFAEKDAYKFVNGILDEAAKQFPEEEASSEYEIKDEFIDEFDDDLAE